MNTIRILIIGYYGFNNAGDELMLAALIRSIRELQPSALITVMSGNREETESRYGVSTIAYSMPGRIKRWIAISSTLVSTDILLFGGGTFLQDYGVRGWRPIAFYLKLVLAARLLGRRVGIVGAGAGPLATAPGRLISRWIVDMAHVIALRDQESLKLLIDIGCSAGRMMLGTDLVVPYCGNIHTAGVPERLKMGISFFPFYTYVHGDSEKQRVMTNEVAKLLAALSGEYELYFFCFQENVDGADNLYAEFLSDHHRISFEVVLFSTGADLFMERIAEMDYVIGMRYHFMLLAFLAGVPAICAVSYHPKVESLLREMGSGENVLPIEQFTAESVLKMLPTLTQHASNPSALAGYLQRGTTNRTALEALFVSPDSARINR